MEEDDNQTLANFYVLAMGMIANSLNFLINATSTGEIRNKLTEMNIAFMQFKQMIEDTEGKE